jgi:hypothetical protein
MSRSKYVYKLVEAELNIRKEFDSQIMNVVLSRCDEGWGRVPRGALLAYIYGKLGFSGRIGNDFAIYFSRVLNENGIRSSSYSGKRCFCGIKWKGEDLKNWRRPLAEDLPKFNGSFFLMPETENQEHIPSISWKSKIKMETDALHDL